MKLTRIHYCKNLNKNKLEQLKKQAALLGRVRSKVWREYGSISGLKLKDRTIRDAWMRNGVEFNVSANAWKEMLRDTMGDIKAYREAAKEKVKKAIRVRTNDNEEQKRLYTLLKYDNWMEENFLRRQMRKHFKHGVNHTSNQIIVRSDMCKTYELNGQCWLKVPSLVRGKQIHVPLNTTMEFAPTGTLRIIIKDDVVEVHSTYDAPKGKPCGNQTVGVDKGYTEAFVDSDGNVYGEGLGKLISSESDYLNKKYKARNKLHALAKSKPHKCNKIIKNNLGRKKLNKRQTIQKAKLKTLAFTAAQRLFDKAGVVVCEDLSSHIASKHSYGKNINRKLNTWCKGILADSLEQVSKIRCSDLHLVNAAYTSQCDSMTHNLLLGKRVGERFYRENGDVIQADYNAAKNVLARLYDKEITLYTPFKKVRQILLERTDSFRLSTVSTKTLVTSSI